MGRAILASGLVALTLLGAACGKKGPPRAPEPRGPLPPQGVEARQEGERSVVTFTVPKARGDKPWQQPIRAEIVRVEYSPGVKAPTDAEAFRLRGVVVASLDRDPLVPGTRLKIEDEARAQLQNRGIGWTLRYGVRVRDRRGRTSPLVVAPELVMAEPRPAPTGLKGEATADGVRLEWEPIQGAEAKYNLYRAPVGQEFPERPVHPEPLTTPAYLDAAATVGSSYRYAVRTLLAEGLPLRESDFSSEIAVLAEDRFEPQAPTGLVAVQEGKAVRLFWNPNQERDLSGYRLYRRAGGDTWTRIGPDPIGEPLFLDREVTAGERIAYRVTAVDRATPPNESAPSSVVELDVVSDPAVQPSESAP